MKERAEKSAITSLLDKNDVVLTHIEDILEEVSDFYATLYSDKVSVSDRNASMPYLCHNVSAQLSSEEKMFCDQSLTVDELGAALKILSNGKAPGIDGLPTEFFKMFWDDLKDVFLDVLNESFHKGVLPESMRMSVIALIYKRNRAGCS
jgi:hypothetical protein